MNIVVLGGHGFVGTKLSERLARDGHHVMPMSRRDGLDLTDFDVTRRRFLELKPDVIYHCAAHVGSVHYVTSYAGAVTQDNVRMALNIYRAVQEVCPTVRIVNPLANCSYPGTADVYYESEWEKGEVHPSVYAYGNSKRMTYVLSWAYRQQYGTKSVNFFVPNTFGPGDHTDPNKTHAINGMILRMIKAQRAGDKEFEVWGTGNPIREWGYIDDVVEILARGATIAEDLTYPVNIAQNKGYSVKESAQLIAKAIGFQGNLVFNTKYQDGAPIKIMDDGKFRKLFPDFVFTEHEHGIREAVNYYKSVLD